MKGRVQNSLNQGDRFDSAPLCTLPIPGRYELTVLVLIILTAYIDIYCGRNQKQSNFDSRGMRDDVRIKNMLQNLEVIK